MSPNYNLVRYYRLDQVINLIKSHQIFLHSKGKLHVCIVFKIIAWQLHGITELPSNRVTELPSNGVTEYSYIIFTNKSKLEIIFESIQIVILKISLVYKLRGFSNTSSNYQYIEFGLKVLRTLDWRLCRIIY